MACIDNIVPLLGGSSAIIMSKAIGACLALSCILPWFLELRHCAVSRLWHAIRCRTRILSSEHQRRQRRAPLSVVRHRLAGTRPGIHVALNAPFGIVEMPSFVRGFVAESSHVSYFKGVELPVRLSYVSAASLAQCSEPMPKEIYISAITVGHRACASSCGTVVTASLSAHWSVTTAKV